MKCPDCVNVQTIVEEFTSNRDNDVFEAIWECPSCGEVFIATIYRCTTKEKGGEAQKKETEIIKPATL